MMSNDYVYILSRHHPDVEVMCVGDPTIYANLVVVSGELPTQSHLDVDAFNIYKTDSVAYVDQVADQVYALVAPSPAKLQEYIEAEKDAQIWYADNSASAPYVAVWAQAKGWTMQQAADDIMAAANKFRQSMIFIRTKRLDAKEAIRNATTASAIDSILATYDANMNYLKSILVP